MLKLAILKPKIEKDKHGQARIAAWIPVFETENEQLEAELIEKVFFHLGGKDSYRPDEIAAAFSAAFNEYKTEFKKKTVTLP